jgi:ABC-2 type transport system permease protein
MEAATQDRRFELREVTGPSAFGHDGDRRRFWDLLWLLSVTDFRVRYANTFLGYVWTILRPLVFFGVIFLVIREILGFGRGIENYGLILIVSLVLFQYFQDTTNAAVRSLSARESMVRKMDFPRIIVPLSVSLTALFTLLLNLVAVFALLLISGLQPRASWLLLTVVIMLLIALATGISMILSVSFVRSEDTGQAWTLIARLLFYASPVLYPLDVVPESFRDVIAVNPLSPLLTQARVWVVDPSAPTAAEATSPLIGVVVPLALLVAIGAFGLWIFTRDAPRVAESL